jgi:hypothetical protein
MTRKLTPPEPWWAEAADLMARCNISVRQAAAELGIDLTIEEADNIKGRKLFQKALDEAKIAYYNEIGSNPKLSRDVVVGQIYELANVLTKEGEAYKASDVLLKLAKIKGWIGYEPDTLYKMLSGLTQRDIDEMKQKLSEEAKQDEGQATEASTDIVRQSERLN